MLFATESDSQTCEWKIFGTPIRDGKFHIYVNYVKSAYISRRSVGGDAGYDR
jgi:hypothetical protein